MSITKFLSLFQPVIWPFIKWYLSKPRWYTFDNLQIRVLPTVFHPGLFFSTKVMYQYMITKEIENKQVLELGAGSGLISAGLAARGALVTASDINPLAIAAIKVSCIKNSVKVSTIVSDLFDSIPWTPFDFILINPPYFAKDPVNLQEKAFYAGKNFEYFYKLFNQLISFMSDQNQVIMILSENTDIEAIREIASKGELRLTQIHSQRILFEWQYLFLINKLR